MKRILYIEDNDQNFYLVQFILQKAGYEVVQERDGKKGIEKAGEMKPDLILLDILLPGMDGYYVARELRKLPDISTVPVVAITSYAMAGDREKTLQAGCSGYIEKPINPDTFLAQVNGFLKT